ncbi:MAG: LCP family protein [Clostridiales bacterium]|nr:LCP family protein [Clostridiales bacterium]
MSKVMKIVLIALLVVVLAVAAVGVYVLTSMRSDAVVTIEKPVDLAASEDPDLASITIVSDEPTPSPTPMPIYEEEAKDDTIVNILLIGTDSRNVSAENADGRSDSMILASLNEDKGTLTLVSFMRDSRVWRIGKKGKFSFQNKLNGAYRGGYGGGGPGELINTINYNFDLDIQEYIAIGFDGFAALIDKIGGLDVPLDQAEINFINDRITGYHVIEPDIVKNADPVRAEPGIVHLDGAQCLIYARNRHTGFDGGSGNDFDRVSRQQEIIQLIYQKVTTQMNEQSVLALISFASNYISTNMKLETMTELAKLLLANKVEFVSTTVPAVGTYDNYYDKEAGVETDQLEFDIDEAAAALQELLYGVVPTPTPTPAG